MFVERPGRVVGIKNKRVKIEDARVIERILENIENIQKWANTMIRPEKMINLVMEKSYFFHF